LQAQATLGNIQNTIATISQEISTQGTGTDNYFKVLDAPMLPNQPVSRLKLLLIAGAIGLGSAIFAYALYTVISIRRNRTVYTPLDLQKVTELPVIMQLPYLTETTISRLFETVSHSNVLEGDEVVTSR